MKFLQILFLACMVTIMASAQSFSRADYSSLQKKEDSLQRLSEKIIQGVNPIDRLKADSIFTKVLVRALKTKHSFNYPFDSLNTISKLYAPDSTFRVYTWQMVINDNVIRQHGAIQMKTSDGSLKLFPLIDKSDITINMQDTIANNFGWMGAVYYKLVLTKHQGNSYYTLLGYDENNIRSNKKIIELLTFDNGQPVFGARQFSVASGFGYNNKMARFVMEYKKQASPRLTYDADLDMIIFEHLVSESNQPNKKWTLIGDGDYEGFKWTDGKWVYVNKVFNEVTAEGNAPMPVPLRDDAGKLDETKLKGNESSSPAKKKKDN
ncbi:MAG: hypothetical protein EOO07_19835 [Chitinophagaceae bacterium]|nr:MAG: hypothetical protein EOO07_19835 [Chitinophagaceae bacterium]